MTTIGVLSERYVCGTTPAPLVIIPTAHSLEKCFLLYFIKGGQLFAVHPPSGILEFSSCTDAPLLASLLGVDAFLERLHGRHGISTIKLTCRGHSQLHSGCMSSEIAPR